MSKVSDLPEIIVLEDIDEIYVVDNSEGAGSRDKRITGANLKTSVQINPVASQVAYERPDINKKDVALTSNEVESALTDLDDKKLSTSGSLPMLDNLNMNNNDITNVDSVDFNDNLSKPAHQEGRVFYDKDGHTLAVYNDNTGVTHQLGQEHLIRVYNNSGSVIGDGVPVYVTGTEGAELRATIGLARADNATTSRVIGLTASVIPNNSFGFITRMGLINDVDTSAFNDGDTLYLSASISGGITNTPPSQGNFEVLLGYVVHADSVSGRILVDIAVSLSNLIGDANTTISAALKASAGTITKGSVVYLSGNDGTTNLVELSNASSATTMPVLGVVRTPISNTTAGIVTTFGTLEGVNTSGYAVGDELYASTTPGQLTNIRPTGTALVQEVAVVSKVGLTDGVIEVVGAGRSDALPNIPNNSIWRGDTNGVPEEVDFDIEVANNPAVVANTAKVSADGSVTTHSDVTSAGSGQIITDTERIKLNGIEANATADAASLAAPPDVAAAGSAGTDTNTYANADHTHGHGNQAGGALHSTATTSVNGFMSSTDKTKLNKLDVGYIQYVNSAPISTNSTTFVNMTLDTDINSDLNGYFTKVDANTFRVDFTGKIRVTLKASAYSDVNDRSGEFGIQHNATDLTYSQIHLFTRNSVDRKNGAEIAFMLPVTVNDTIRGRFRSPETALIQVAAQHAMVKIEVYSIG